MNVAAFLECTSDATVAPLMHHCHLVEDRIGTTTLMASAVLHDRLSVDCVMEGKSRQQRHPHDTCSLLLGHKRGQDLVGRVAGKYVPANFCFWSR